MNENTRQNISPETAVNHERQPQHSEVFVNLDKVVEGGITISTDESPQESESPLSDDDDSPMTIGVGDVKVSDKGAITSYLAFDSQNELNELQTRLSEKDRELSELQKAVEEAEKRHLSVEKLVFNLKNALLQQENLKNGEIEDMSAKNLFATLLDSLEAEKESCRRMEVENTKLRGQVRKCVVGKVVLVVVEFPRAHTRFPPVELTKLIFCFFT